MVDGRYAISSPLKSTPVDFVERVVEQCSKTGFFDEERSTEYHRASELDEIRDSDGGLVELFHGDSQFHLIFSFDRHSPPDASEADIELSMKSEVLEQHLQNPETGFVADLFTLVQELTVEIDPLYVYSVGTSEIDYKDFHRAIVPEELPVADYLSHISWLGVYPSRTVEAFGGVEYVLDAPTRQTDQLTSGHVFLVSDERPWDMPDDELDEYLLAEASQ